MKKQIRKVLALGLLVCGGLLNAVTQFRSPISLYWGTQHYPLEEVDNSWWYDVLAPGCCRNTCWEIDSWAGAYHRCADAAFFDPCSNSSTRKKVSLSTLFFGKDEFVVADIFPDSKIPMGEAINNPLLSTAKIKPRFSYDETGVVFGLHAERKFGCKNNWRLGMRASMPYKVIDVTQKNLAEAKFEEKLEDMVAECAFNLQTGTQSPVDIGDIPTLYEYAYRLDFLSALIRVSPLVQNFQRMVQYSNGALPLTRIAGSPVGVSDTNPLQSAYPPVLLIKSTDGSIPPKTPIVSIPPSVPPRQAIGKQSDQASGPLPADGAGADGQVFFFGDETINYEANLGADTAAQSTLWVVTHLTDDGLAFAGNAVGIRDAVHSILNALELNGDATSPIQFLCNQCDINLAQSERILGIGDLRTEIYGGWNDCNMFAYGVFGILWPTGRKDSDPRRVYFVTPGNNRHFEIKFGIEYGYHPFEWFAFEFKANYNRVARRNEKIAAAFAGATIRNINPTVDADVSWNYGIINLDFTFFHPCNRDLGCSFGYELWGRSDDNVCFTCPTALTCLGTVGELDPCVAEVRTNAMTHKLRAEAFYRCNFVECFAGASQVIGGRNAMRESEIHLGLAFYF